MTSHLIAAETERDANQRLLDADATEIQRLRDHISGLETEIQRLRAGTPWRVCVDAERDALRAAMWAMLGAGWDVVESWGDLNPEAGIALRWRAAAAAARKVLG